MIIFFWDIRAQFIQDDNGTMPLESKPKFSFEYEYIKYNNEFEKQYGKNENEQLRLSDEQIEEIEAFVINKRIEYGIRKLVVDEQGFFRGHVDVANLDLKFIVPHGPPNNDYYVWNFKEKDWQQIYYYDSNFKPSTKENGIGFTIKNIPEKYFDVVWSQEDENWVLNDKTDNWKTIYKNKVVSDIIIDYIHTNLEIIHDEDSDAANEFLLKIKDVIIKESKKIIDETITNTNKLNKIKILNDDTENLFDSLSATDSILNIYSEYESFKMSIKENTIYKNSTQFTEEIVSSYIKENDIT
jgi:hypothetical protein